ncbi:hypothetical protein GOV12_02750 [Candidatus Pacearchaeota archaeon]|nr:hypothetical protein [Candidatus Pacearchaeota archaeon]
MLEGYSSKQFIFDICGDWFARRVIDVYSMNDMRLLEIGLEQAIEKSSKTPKERKISYKRIPLKVSRDYVFNNNVGLLSRHYDFLEEYERVEREKPDPKLSNGFQYLEKFIDLTHQRFQEKYQKENKKRPNDTDIDEAFRNSFENPNRFIDFVCESTLLTEKVVGVSEIKLDSGKLVRPTTPDYLLELYHTLDLTLDLYVRALKDFDYPNN